MSEKTKSPSRFGKLRGASGKKPVSVPGTGAPDSGSGDKPKAATGKASTGKAAATGSTPEKTEKKPAPALSSLEPILPDFGEDDSEGDDEAEAAGGSGKTSAKSGRDAGAAADKPGTEASVASKDETAADQGRSEDDKGSDSSPARTTLRKKDSLSTRPAKADIPALALKDVRRVFKQGNEKLEILKGVSFSIRAGEMVALVGPSGAGKSTLLHMAGLLEQPDSGDVLICGEKCNGISDNKRTQVRLKQLGFVYQFHHLLPEFSALENIMLPQLITGLPRNEAKRRARELLSMVNLKHRENHRPARLSGGEQQRVAVARALANVPSVLMADEPTGNLDPHTAEHVFEMMRTLVRHIKLAALVATHNLELAERMDRVLVLRDGHIEEA